MTNLELVLNMLAKATTTEISKEKKPKNFDENKIIAKTRRHYSWQYQTAN